MPDDTDEELTADEAEKFTRFLAKHEEAQAKEAARKKPPKDFDDGATRIAERVIEILDARAAERQKAKDDADEAPDRTDKPKGFLGIMGG